MRRFVFLFLLLPLAVVIIVLAVANRGDATFSLDPFGAASPALSLTAPLFVILFATLLLGVIVGGIAAWLRQGKWRRLARAERANAERLRQEVERLNQRAAVLSLAAPSPGERDAA